MGKWWPTMGAAVTAGQSMVSRVQGDPAAAPIVHLGGNWDSVLHPPAFAGSGGSSGTCIASSASACSSAAKKSWYGSDCSTARM